MLDVLCPILFRGVIFLILTGLVNFDGHVQVISGRSWLLGQLVGEITGMNIFLIPAVSEQVHGHCLCLPWFLWLINSAGIFYVHCKHNWSRNLGSGFCRHQADVLHVRTLPAVWLCWLIRAIVGSVIHQSALSLTGKSSSPLLGV